MRNVTSIAVAFVLLVSTTASAASLTAADLDRRRKALGDLIDEQWEYQLRTSPEYASILGDKRFNDKVTDPSEEANERNVAETRRFLARFEAIDPLAFSEQERLNRELMIRDLRDTVEGAKFRPWLMPVTQRSGIHLNAATLPSLLSFATAKDYDDYIARLHQFPGVMDATLANMKKGLGLHLMPPKFLLERVAQQASGIASQKAEETPFAAPLTRFPAAVTDSERTRIRQALLAEIDASVLPQYKRFAKYVRDEYAPHGRTDVGVWSLPDGAERYAFAVRRLTTTNLSPAQIHDIGLSEVSRLEGEMLAIAKKLGYQDLKSFNEAIDKNADLKAKSPEQILELYRKFIGQMYARLPELFGRLPKAKLEVVPIESFRAKNAAAADYNAGAPDGSRPGRVNINTSDAESRKIITIESTAYHEGVPGHHMQISIAQELADVPEFRRQGGYTAFVEGWALYSEKLGKEIGFYSDPYSDYGRLQDEMLRAIRLVVDTGLHSKKWTREQVVQFFRDHSAIDEVDIQSETDRYIVWPGQALGYKMGQLKITELRTKAQQRLGSKFDLRRYHDEVLGAGALPLGVLEERIDRWIKLQEGERVH